VYTLGEWFINSIPYNPLVFWLPLSDVSCHLCHVYVFWGIGAHTSFSFGLNACYLKLKRAYSDTKHTLTNILIISRFSISLPIDTLSNNINPQELFRTTLNLIQNASYLQLGSLRLGSRLGAQQATSSPSMEEGRSLAFKLPTGTKDAEASIISFYFIIFDVLT
jgi:hypothetical protein